MLSHDTLLLASGTSEGRLALRNIFAQEYHLLEAATDLQTMLLLEQNRHCIAAVLLDISDGENVTSAVLTELEKQGSLPQTPVVVLTPPADAAAVGAAFTMGAIEAMSADTDFYVLRQRMRNIVDLHRHKWHLEDMVREQSAILRKSNDAMVDVLSSLIEYRSVESGQHILRIRRFTEILLRELQSSSPFYGLTDEKIDMISGAAALHDIGKISIPDSILGKSGPLTREEWEIMKTHSDTGSRIIQTLGHLGDQEYLRYAYNICRYHHERWDGSGYPEGLSGDDIPICAQVVGLADAYDALTSKRVYKDALSCEEAASMICNGECGAFSTTLIECFKHVSGHFAEMARAYADGLSPKTEHFDTRLPGPGGQELNALQLLGAKYQMFLHYLDAAVVEVDLDQGTYHVVYNPDPYLTMLGGTSSLRELDEKVVAQARTEEAKKDILRLTQEHMPRFFREGLMRMSHRVPVYDRETDRELIYELTVLRQSMADPDLHRILVIWQRDRTDTDGTSSNMDDIEKMATRFSICRNDRHLTLEGSTRELRDLTGFSDEELDRLFGGSLLRMVEDQERAYVMSNLHRQLEKGKEAELVLRVKNRDGRVLSLIYRCRLIWRNGAEYLVGVLLNVTETGQRLRLLEKQMAQYQIILAQTENVLYEWDMEQDILTFSENWEQMFGYPPITGNLFDLLTAGSHFHPEDVGVVYESMTAMRNGSDYQMMEARIAKSDGRYLWCRFRSTGLRDEQGKLKKIVGIIINIDEEKRSAQALQERAERDSLTKLLNKDATKTQAQTYLADFAGSAGCAMLIIDLDDFKGINDSFGHLFGDAVLTQVAKEIRKMVRPMDIVGRIGGDEFLVLMRGIERREVVEERCRMLTQALPRIFQNQLRGRPLSCSIGAALFPQHGRSYGDLFKRADQALYLAKSRGKNGFAIFDNRDAFSMGKVTDGTAVGTSIDSDSSVSPSGGNIISYAFHQLYESWDLEETIRELLALIGRQLGVSRVYIFENDRDNRTCSNTFEWCNEGIEPQIHLLQNISYETDIPSYMKYFNEQDLLYCGDIKELPEDLYEILEPQNIKSLLHCAIRDQGVFRGYMGFDECRVNRYWTREQIDMLTYFAEMLAVFLMKKRAQDDLKQM